MFKPDSLILVDMDGVLADYSNGLKQSWLAHPLVQENNWTPLYVRTDQFKMPPQLRERWGEDAVKVFREITCSGNYYRDLEPIAGALDGMQFLENQGHNVFICSAPTRHTDTCASEKIAWVREHLGPEWVNRTIITKDKTLVHGDYLLDDNPNVTGLLKPSWTHIIYSAPYNAGTVTWQSIMDIENNPTIPRTT